MKRDPIREAGEKFSDAFCLLLLTIILVIGIASRCSAS